MFLPENIDLAHSEEYHLSIRLSPDGFSFCIHCPDNPSIFHQQGTPVGNKLSYTDNIKKLIFDLGFFSQPFKKTTVTLVSPYYTLVPHAFYDKKQVRELFHFNFHGVDGVLLSDFSSIGEYHLVYPIDEEVHSFLSRNLWNPVFHHHTTPLLQLFETRQAENNRRTCFVDFHDRNATIACFAENKLLSVNTFPGINPHDTTYFIASVWEKQAFDQTTDTLCLSGDIDSQKTVTDILKKLIRHVDSIELNPGVILTGEQRRLLPTDMLAALCV